MGQDIPLSEFNEVSQALAEATRNVTQETRAGSQDKEVLRRGVNVTVLSRNHELQHFWGDGGAKQKLISSGADSVEMEMATVAGIGHIHGLPTGGLLRISDLPYNGDPKLPGMGKISWKGAVEHTRIMIGAIDKMREDGDVWTTRKPVREAMGVAFG